MTEERREEVFSVDGLGEIKLFVRQDLYRAFQRCVWIQMHESDRDRLEIMEEVVLDFLIKHNC